MKAILVLLAAVAVAVQAVPYGMDPEYAMVPDGDGNFKLVNLNAEPDIENRFVPHDDIIFTVFTARNPTEGQVIRWNDPETVRQSDFDPNNPTRFIIHGWNNNGGSAVNVLIRTAFLSRGDFNVIVVDWGVGAQNPNYITASRQVAGVGAVTADLIRNLQNNFGVNPNTVTVAGHSLGAHAAGFVGKNIFGADRLGSIAALDPALPLFSIDNPGGRVDAEDAEYVESIHTNAGTLGFDLPLGIASFYPNFGSSQPGCGIDITGNCAHGRAVEYYAESIITDRHFWARQCRDYENILAGICISSGLDRKMGGDPLDTLARGVYWLTTASSSPFATGIL